MKIKKNKNPKDVHVYLIGSGIAGMASAVYLEKDAGIRPENIHILEKDKVAGGSLDGAGDNDKGYVIRGARMFEEQYVCLWDVLSNIPSLEDPNVNVRDETFEFSDRFVTDAHVRLMKDGKKVDTSSFGLSKKQQSDMLKLTFAPESILDNKRVEDWFDGAFFETNYWYIWTSMFAMQKWSSLTEMRRYMRRFIHLVAGLDRIFGIMHTKYNQYDSIILPMQNYLTDLGVSVDFGREVVDIDFDLSDDTKTAKVLRMKDGNDIHLGENDYVFITNGSIVESTDIGDWNTPAKLKGVPDSGSWKLWKNIAAKDKTFGNPDKFCGNIAEQKWFSFTVTMKDTTFLDYLEEFSGNVDGTAGLITFIDSSWLLSFDVSRQPHYANQPKGTHVFWGYALYNDVKGDYSNKTFDECTGEEMLDELFYHMKVQDMMKPIVAAGKVDCVPVSMPFVDSLFMPRAKGDRPDVLVKGATNFAFLGQFAEVPKDTVFTVEYSVRTAQTAVYGLFDTDKEVIPVYDSIHKPKYLVEALQALAK